MRAGPERMYWLQGIYNKDWKLQPMPELKYLLPDTVPTAIGAIQNSLDWIKQRTNGVPATVSTLSAAWDHVSGEQVPVRYTFVLEDSPLLKHRAFVGASTIENSKFFAKLLDPNDARKYHPAIECCEAYEQFFIQAQADGGADGDDEMVDS